MSAFNKPLLRGAALTVLAAASTAAYAQSSVTLFGIVDLGVRQVKNGDDSVSSVSSNGSNSSRLGVRGVEDLGGGLSAGFWLETGLNPDTGTTADSSRFWNRRSTVSLSGGFGEVRLGRDFTPTFTGYADYDAFGTNGVAAADKFSSALGSGADTRTRADNLVSYFTPAGLGGFYGQASVAAGEGTDGKKYYGGRAGYRTGALDVSASAGRTEVAPNAAGDDEYDFYNLGAAYDFGIVKLLGYYSQMRYADLKLGVANIGAHVPLGSYGTLRMSYADADASGQAAGGGSTDGNDASQLALGYLYDFSKRTQFYGTVARVDNDGAAAFAVGGTAVAGDTSTGYEIGLRHRF